MGRALAGFGLGVVVGLVFFFPYHCVNRHVSPAAPVGVVRSEVRCSGAIPIYFPGYSSSDPSKRINEWVAVIPVTLTGLMGALLLSKLPQREKKHGE